MVAGPVERVVEWPDLVVEGRKEVWVWRFEGVKVEVVRDGEYFVK